MLVQGIAGDRYALGYFGYAYYVENTDKLKLVAVDGGQGCVAPSPETVESGEYAPLSRPLFIYVAESALEKPQVKAFVRYYLEQARVLVPQVGYVPLRDQQYQAELAEIG
jgi:phosphate transport system substrate-binding protein